MTQPSATTLREAAQQLIRFETWKETTGKTDISEFLKTPFEAALTENILRKLRIAYDQQTVIPQK